MRVCARFFRGRGADSPILSNEPTANQWKQLGMLKFATSEVSLLLECQTYPLTSQLIALTLGIPWQQFIPSKDHDAVKLHEALVDRTPTVGKGASEKEATHQHGCKVM